MIKITEVDGDWHTGEIDDNKFQAKVYDVGSKYGINQGTVSKLWIKDVCNYERGWDEYPSEENEYMVDSLVDYFKGGRK